MAIGNNNWAGAAGTGGSSGASLSNTGVWNGRNVVMPVMYEKKPSNLEKAKKALYNKRGEMPKVKRSNLEAAKMALRTKTHVSAYDSMATAYNAYYQAGSKPSQMIQNPITGEWEFKYNSAQNPYLQNPYLPIVPIVEGQDQINREEMIKLHKELMKAKQWGGNIEANKTEPSKPTDKAWRFLKGITSK